MADEFTPEASVDFESMAAAAAAAVNGDGPHFQPPPEQVPDTPPPIRRRSEPRPQAGPSLGLDPFQALESLVRDQGLMYRELGDMNAKLAILQLQTIVAFGAAVLLAVLVWKFARPSE